MTVHELRSVLLWCLILNYVLLILWFAVFVLAHDALYRLHTRWFKLSPEAFDAGHYVGMAIYKVGIMLFVLIPFVALCIMYR
jgi:hypothetical protein